MPLNTPRLSGPRSGLLARLMAGIGAIIALTAAAVIGFFALMITFGVVVIGSIGVMLRVWWLRRQFQAGRGPAGQPPGNDAAGSHRQTVIDGEYTVVQRRRQ